MTNRAVGYVRVSTQNQAEEGESLNNQKEAISTYCQAYNLELLNIFADEGVSGSTIKERPDLNKLLEEAAKGKFDYLIIHRLSRLGRNCANVLSINEMLAKYNVKMVSIKEQIDVSTPNGRLFLTLLAAVAEFEREIIKEQMEENRFRLWKQGKIIIGKPPYGYNWNKKESKYEINPTEALIYNRIVDMYVNHGMGYKDIAIILRNEGIKCNRAYFSGTHIGYILKNKCYTGHYVRNTKKYKGNRKLKEDKPASQHITIEIEPLIDLVTWEKIQDKVNFNKTKTKRSSSPEYWLRNVLKCAECGASVKPKNAGKRKDGTSHRYYICYWAGASPRDLAEKGKKEKCCLPFIRAEKLENLVLMELVDMLTFYRWKDVDESGKRISKHRRFMMEIIEPTAYDDKIAQLTQHIKNIEKEINSKKILKNKVYMLIDGVDLSKRDNDTLNDIYEKLKECNEDIRLMESKISQKSSERNMLINAKENAQQTYDFIKDNEDLMDKIANDIYTLRPEDQQMLIESLVDNQIKISKRRDSSCRTLKGDDGELLNWCLVSFRIKFNSSILEKLISEGKIPSLDKNGHH